MSPMTLAEFLAYDDGTDAVYELENGELRRMPTDESEINFAPKPKAHPHLRLCHRGCSAYDLLHA